MKKRNDTILFTLAVLEGLIALVWLLGITETGSRPFFLGLSRTRLALVILAGVIWLVVILWGINWHFLRFLKNRLESAVEESLHLGEYLTAASVVLAAVALLGLAITAWKALQSPGAIAYYDHWLGPRFSLLNSLVRQALPLIGWGAALAVQALAWLVMRYAKPGLWRWDTALETFLACQIGTLTLFHWIALALSLTAFKSIPGWHWNLFTKPVTPRHFLFAGIGVVLLLLVNWILKSSRPSWRHVLALMLFGYAVQVGMGVVDGKGIESLREKYYSSLHRSYTNKAASRDESVIESIRRYEEIYSNMLFPSTKPPGVMAIYIGLERSINSLTHKTSQEGRFAQLSNFIAIIFPILSLTAIALIYIFVKRVLYPGQDGTGVAALLAPLFFSLAGNIVLFSLFLDQVFYPSLFLCTAWLVIFVFQRSGWGWAVLAGVCLYSAIFFSFSVLPVFAVPVFYAAARVWMDWSKANLLRQAGFAAATAAGLGCAFLAFRVIFNYDFFARYSNAMSVVYYYDFYSRIGVAPGQPVTLSNRLFQIFQAAFLNNMDIGSLVAFPVFALFLVRGGKAVWAVFRRKGTAGDAAQSSLFLAFLALNVIGQMNGEAGRLWMFWVPVIASLTAIEIAPRAKRQPWLVYGLIVTQFVTLLLTYQFQDLIF